jgi:hypothetical protein
MFHLHEVKTGHFAGLQSHTTIYHVSLFLSLKWKLIGYGAVNWQKESGLQEEESLCPLSNSPLARRSLLRDHLGADSLKMTTPRQNIFKPV